MTVPKLLEPGTTSGPQRTLPSCSSSHSLLPRHHDLGVGVGVEVGDGDDAVADRRRGPQQRAVRPIRRRAGDHLGPAVEVEVGGHGAQARGRRPAQHRPASGPPQRAVAVQDLAADDDLGAPVAVEIGEEGRAVADGDLQQRAPPLERAVVLEGEELVALLRPPRRSRAGRRRRCHRSPGWPRG